MKRLTLLGLLSPVALLAACNQPSPKAMAPAPQPAPAQGPVTASAGAAGLTKQGLSACADVLRGQGFFVTDKEIDRPLYEFDAIKENQKWKIKMSGNCEIVLQKLD